MVLVKKEYFVSLTKNEYLLFWINLGDKNSHKCRKSKNLIFNNIYLFINMFNCLRKLTIKPFGINFSDKMKEKCVKNEKLIYIIINLFTQNV